MIGAYTINRSVFDMFLMVGLGVLGHLMKKTGFEPGPLVLAFVLGGPLESSFRRSMRIFGGDITGVLTQPITAVLLAATVAVAIGPAAVRWSRRARMKTTADA
ncbi:tripartite tricarboxylate transporter permease [Streptomyces mesophilus]|uniref:tripartite tricarboxylate transporter permease n=1 Tax=Streptomyces mesophilus TaxID=1775132 RepID=UPI0033294A06